MSELYTTETILRYLDGEMEGDELAGFENALASNPSLKGEVEQLRIAIGAVQLAGAESAVKKIHAEMRMKPGGAKTVSMFPRMIVRMAAAAAVVLMLAAGWLYTISSTDNIIEDHFVSYSIDASRSGSKFTPLQEAYSKGQYEAVLGAYDSRSFSAQDSLLVGLSYYKTAKYDDAERFLAPLRRSPLYGADADYYLAFTYLGQGKRQEALLIFRNIHDDARHLYHSAVPSSMLRKLGFRSR